MHRLASAPAHAPVSAAMGSAFNVVSARLALLEVPPRFAFSFSLLVVSPFPDWLAPDFDSKKFTLFLDFFLKISE